MRAGPANFIIAGLTDYPVASGNDNLAIARYESPNAAPTVASFDKSGTEDTTLILSAADFTAGTTNASSGDDALLFGLDTSVPLDQIRFVAATVQAAAARIDDDLWDELEALLPPRHAWLDAPFD